MDDAIPERGGADLARLSLVNRERAVSAGPICHGCELFLEPHQLAFQVEKEPRHARHEALPTASFLSGAKQTFERGHALP
jgi:hypothetical protein